VLPEPLAVGLAIAGGLAVVFAGVFVAGERLFPGTRPSNRQSVGGEHKRRREIRAYLDAIGERYAEDHPVAGHVVDFYLPGRGVAITFDARAYFDLAATDTHPILVEHEMPGVHLGARLPFETPRWERTAGRRESPGDEGSAADSDRAFEVLGLPADATSAEVRAAYRERVKEVHPDQGGDERAFRRVQEAYATAQRRAES
jgi:hypothetical protein